MEKSSHGKCHQKILNVIKKNHMENMPQKILIVVKEGRSVSGFPLSWLSYCSSCGGTNALQTTHRHITRMCKCSCALLSAVLCVLCNIVQKSNSASCLFLIENFFIGVIFPTILRNICTAPYHGTNHHVVISSLRDRLLFQKVVIPQMSLHFVQD